MRDKIFVSLGFIIPIVLWATIIPCGLATENYSWLVNTVSELGAVGTKTQAVFTAGLVTCSILSILFVAGLYRTAKKAGLIPLPVLLILTFSFAIFGAAVFPLPLELHGVLGSPAMLLPLSPLLAILLWKKETIPHVRIGAGIILALMLLGFLTLTPEILPGYFGLKQRFFHIGWSCWFTWLSLKFLPLAKTLPNP